LRWQAPQEPEFHNTSVIPAVDQPPICPQSGAFGVPESYGFNSGLGDEDCLFLNVRAAPNASALPVLVWIHGGGYSLFGATYDPSVWMNANDNAFVAVEIQYRLGAFGFLASPEIREYGRLNAGLLDQRFALEWVQKHIGKFGGDPARVTIAGESAGAGAVMHHALAEGGLESNLFSNIIAASPYSPAIYKYNDDVPLTRYKRFAELAGCAPDDLRSTGHTNDFSCLVAADSATLQNASGIVSTTEGYFGSFGFLPVIDGQYIKERPALQLERGRVSGKRLLVGSNANEGVPLTKPDITTRQAYDSFVSDTFPQFTPHDVARLNEAYQIDSSQPGNNLTRFDTLGDSGPTCLNQSSIAAGVKQTAFAISAETTFVCPAEWVAEAFSTGERQAWRYQYSVTPSHHGADLSAYFAEGATVPSADFRHAIQKIWGNFIINNSPVISVADATANYANATVPEGTDGNIDWPEYSVKDSWQMDLNTTGGLVTDVVVTPDFSYFVRSGAGIVNHFRLTDTRTWEGGRGLRCAFWRTVSSRVPQ
jgi:carboxylesterase type B